MHPGKDLEKVSLIFTEDRRSVRYVSSVWCLPASFTSFLLPILFPSTNTMGVVPGRMNVTNLASPYLDFKGRTLSSPMNPTGIGNKWAHSKLCINTLYIARKCKAFHSSSHSDPCKGNSSLVQLWVDALDKRSKPSCWTHMPGAWLQESLGALTFLALATWVSVLCECSAPGHGFSQWESSSHRTEPTYSRCPPFLCLFVGYGRYSAG